MYDSEDNFIYLFKYLRHQLYWKSILTTALFNKYADYEKLKEILLAYYYQSWVAGFTTARIKQTSFNILRIVKDNGSIDTVKSEISKNLITYSTTELFKKALESSFVYERNWAKAILLLVEYFSSDAATQKYVTIDKKLHLEHVLPQEPKTHGWDKIFSEEEIEKLTNSLGNLTLLSSRKNVQALNNDFEYKKGIYKEKDNKIPSFKITQNIINNYDVWDVNAIEKRKIYLLNIINTHLDIF